MEKLWQILCSRSSCNHRSSPLRIRSPETPGPHHAKRSAHTAKRCAAPALGGGRARPRRCPEPRTSAAGAPWSATRDQEWSAFVRRPDHGGPRPTHRNRVAQTPSRWPYSSLGSTPRSLLSWRLGGFADDEYEAIGSRPRTSVGAARDEDRPTPEAASGGGEGGDRTLLSMISPPERSIDATAPGPGLDRVCHGLYP